MNKNYLIQWKSKISGRSGRGTKLFEKQEAERLAEELNREYPQIEHEMVENASEPASEIPPGGNEGPPKPAPIGSTP